jgi:hypothetical protein
LFNNKTNVVLITGIIVCLVLSLLPTQLVKAELNSTSIEIRDQTYNSPVSSIAFPQGEPGTTISNPTNSTFQTQIFGGAGTAKPVVTLVNTGSVTYKIWYNITTFSNGVVVAESYLINDAGATCADANTINNAVTFNTASSTEVTIDASGQKDLYLKINLSNLGRVSGSSTITILGEP